MHGYRPKTVRELIDELEAMAAEHGDEELVYTIGEFDYERPKVWYEPKPSYGRRPKGIFVS